MATRDDLLLHGCIWRYGDKPVLSKGEVERIKSNLVSEKRKDITQYDLIGKRIDYFSSIKVASQKTGVPIDSIRSSADRYKVTGGGFIWRRGKGKAQLQFPETPRPFGNQLRKEICQYTKEGVLVDRYPTIAEAARKTGIHKSHIANTAKGRCPSAGGFVWKSEPSATYFK